MDRRNLQDQSPVCNRLDTKEIPMGRSILLWLIGVPIPIIILLALFWR
ncbi:hypothetical protein [uncultured Reyranella sp.]|nr:hypothetical protein [uncultured Reyranella sp.]